MENVKDLLTAAKDKDHDTVTIISQAVSEVIETAYKKSGLPNKLRIEF